jgi:hypothetical protein
MRVIGHQAVRRDLHASGPAPVRNQLPLGNVVSIRDKRLHAPVATLGDVVRNSGDDNAGQSEHGAESCMTAGSRKEQKMNIRSVEG